MSARGLFAGMLVCGGLVGACAAHAQGCAQCRDNTAATSPATQRAYAHAIELMTAAGAALFIGTLIVFKRNP